MYIKTNTNNYYNNSDFHEIVNISGEFLEEGILIEEENIESNFNSKNEIYYNQLENKIKLKTLDMLKYEKYKKLQNDMLNNILLKELRNAMTFQVISEQQGANPSNKIFTSEQIAAWGNYFGEIAKDNHDLSGLTIEQINPSIFGIIPEIPQAYQNIVI